MDLGGTARPGARATWSCLGPGGPLSYFLSSGCFSRKNIYARKILDQFEFWKIRETSKYTKQGFPVLQIYNQNKGNRWKIPINQYKT
jgi:hypothetical protein